MPPLIIAGEALAAGGAAEGAAAGTGAAAMEGAAAGQTAEAGAAKPRLSRTLRTTQNQVRQSFENETQEQAQPANDNRVSPLAWLFFGISVLLDLCKVLFLFFWLIPAVGELIAAVGSFYISVVEVIVVFGGLWLVGIYKSPKNQTLFTLVTMAVSTADLVPLLDDLPFTSPTVFFMIAKAKAGGSSAGHTDRILPVLTAANDNEYERGRAA